MIRLRELSAEEQQMIERVAQSRTAEARRVERARGPLTFPAIPGNP